MGGGGEGGGGADADVGGQHDQQTPDRQKGEQLRAERQDPQEASSVVSRHNHQVRLAVARDLPNPAEEARRQGLGSTLGTCFIKPTFRII